ncbi:MAG TPA: CpaD family pilus assembly protein [Hyphomonadaceae bacterium]|jgi:pilus assembly protein CpaD|nr:CpaD family pilus assembly protein [Hyphomonadaceae bacterium]
MSQTQHTLAKHIVLLAGASLAVLGGCGHSPTEIAYANREHLQIQAEEITAELKIDSYTSGEKLGVMEREAVKTFAEAYMQEGHGSVIISRPGGGSDDGAAMRAAADARAVMLAEGVDATRIAEGPYDASGARVAPLVISYRTYEAVVPHCPDLSGIDFAFTGTNNALPSFGCAVQTNLAAMIADPSDLVGAQKMDPADIGRRGVIMSKYRQGAPTGAERSQDAKGTISNVGG